MSGPQGGAPEGNENAAKGTEWRNAIRRALAHKSGKTFREGLDSVAKKLWLTAAAFFISALGNSRDGSPS